MEPASALELIRKNGYARTQALAVELHAAPETVDEVLAAQCVAGVLVSCDVVAGGVPQKEYRLSEGGKASPWKPMAIHHSAPRRPEMLKVESTPRVEQSSNAVLVHQPKIEPKGDDTMTVKERLQKALEQAGKNGIALTEFAKHHRLEYQTVYSAMGAMLTAGEAHLARSAGRKNFYALGPAPRTAEDKAADRAGPRRRTKAKTAKGSAAAKKAWRTRRKLQRQGAKVHSADAVSPRAIKAPDGFRCAIYSDGALHIQKGGAHADEIELAEREVRALFSYLEKVLPEGAAA